MTDGPPSETDLLKFTANVDIVLHDLVGFGLNDLHHTVAEHLGRGLTNPDPVILSKVHQIEAKLAKLGEFSREAPELKDELDQISERQKLIARRWFVIQTLFEAFKAAPAEVQKKEHYDALSNAARRQDELQADLDRYNQARFLGRPLQVIQGGKR